jgi:excisionase family DNA binding protein
MTAHDDRGMPAAPFYLSAEGAANRLMVSLRTVDRWVMEGRLPCHRRGDHGWRRFLPEEVDQVFSPARQIPNHESTKDFIRAALRRKPDGSA